MTATDIGYVPTLDYLAWVARQERIDGQLLIGGGSATREQQTWGRAIAEMDRILTVGLTPADRDTAAAVLAYFRAQSPDDALSDYLLDLIVLLRDDQVRRDRLALAASGLLVYRRAQERQAREEAARRQRQASRHIGTPGEALTVRATVNEAHQRAGRLTIYRLVCDDGAVLTYYGLPDFLRSGWVYDLSVIVKRHDVWKGENRTLIRSCAVIGVVEEGSHPGPKVGQR